jgi:hypothetical protein
MAKGKRMAKKYRSTNIFCFIQPMVEQDLAQCMKIAVFWPVMRTKMRPRDIADHSPPSSAEVNNGRSYTSTPPYAFGFLYLSRREL